MLIVTTKLMSLHLHGSFLIHQVLFRCLAAQIWIEWNTLSLEPLRSPVISLLKCGGISVVPVVYVPMPIHNVTMTCTKRRLTYDSYCDPVLIHDRNHFNTQGLGIRWVSVLLLYVQYMYRSMIYIWYICKVLPIYNFSNIIIYNTYISAVQLTYTSNSIITK